MGRYVVLVLLAGLLAGCAATSSSVPGAALAKIRAAHSIVFLSDIRDRVFGTRLSGLLMKPTDDFTTDWHSSEQLGKAVVQDLGRPGRRVEVVPASGLRFTQPVRFDSVDAAFSGLSRAMSQAAPQADADIHLILLQVPVDAVPHPVTGARLRMSGQGLAGLLWEMGTIYKRSYVVRVNNSLNATIWGRAQCIVVYALAAVDAHSHTVIQKFYPRWAEHPLPDDFWIGDYVSLSRQNRDVLRNACLDALTGAVGEDLEKTELRQ